MKLIKIIKVILIVLASLCGIAFLLFLITHIANESYISNYNKGKYATSYLNFTGFTEKYIYSYNVGDSYYQMGDYAKAEELYRDSLQKNPPVVEEETDENGAIKPISEDQQRDCQVRINLALSMVKQLDLSKVTNTNVLEYLEVLYEARDFLVENNCAHMLDDNGHNQDAQTLKNEIDELIKLLEELQDPPPDQPTQPSNEDQTSENESSDGEETSDGDETSDDDQTSEGDETSDGDETSGENETETETESTGEDSGEGQTETTEEDTRTDIEKELESLQNQGNSERNSEMEEGANYGYGGGGICW